MTYQTALTALARNTSVACWGDSLTYGTLDGDVSDANPTYPQTLSAKLGVPVYNGGRGGEATAHIATRQGGLRPLVTLTGGKIPAGSTTPILLTAISPSDGWHNWTGAGRIFDITGTLQTGGAGVAGTLRQDATTANNVFYFVPDAAQPADVTVSAGTSFINTDGDRLRDRINVIWFGPNCDRTNTTAMIRDVTSMANYLTSASKKFFLVSVTSADANGVAANTALKSAFPTQFIDVRNYLMGQGLIDAGITPTSNDTADIAAGYVPRSFRPANGSHLTQTAYNLIGNYIANQIVSSTISIAGTPTPLGGSITQDTITGLSSTGLVKRTGANTLAAATSGTDYLDPTADGMEPDRLTTGFATFNRRLISAANIPSTNGTERYTFFTASKSMTVTQIAVPTGATAQVGATLCRIGLYTVDGSGNITLVASTANDTALWNAANTLTAKALSASYAVTRGTRYAIGLLVVGSSTAPTFMGMVPSGAGSVYGASPRLCAFTSGRTDLDSSVASGSLTDTSAQYYSVLLP